MAVEIVHLHIYITKIYMRIDGNDDKKQDQTTVITNLHNTKHTHTKIQ